MEISGITDRSLRKILRKFEENSKEIRDKSSTDSKKFEENSSGNLSNHVRSW